MLKLTSYKRLFDIWQETS